MASIMTVNRFNPIMESPSLQLTGAKVSLKQASEKYILHRAAVRSSSPAFSTASFSYQPTHSSQESVLHSSEQPPTLNSPTSSYISAKYPAINAPSFKESSEKSFSNDQNKHLSFVVSATAAVSKGINNAKSNFVYKFDRKLSNASSDEETTSKKSSNIESSSHCSAAYQNIKRSQSVRDLVSNILNTVMNKSSTVKPDINNNHVTSIQDSVSHGQEKYESKASENKSNKDNVKVHKKKSRRKKILRVKSQNTRRSSITSEKVISESIKQIKVVTSTMLHPTKMQSNFTKKSENYNQVKENVKSTKINLDTTRLSIPRTSLERARTCMSPVLTTRQSLPSNARRHLLATSRTSEEVPRVLKIYQSERQSGVVSDMGVAVLSAPPTTPVPDMLLQYQYIPCMSDIRAQRAVKSQLEYMQKEEKKKQQKEMGEKQVKEKSRKKEQEKKFKARQRQEIYALNRVMTELENSNFVNFCKAHGIPV